jgi:hypothetical protein
MAARTVVVVVVVAVQSLCLDRTVAKTGMTPTLFERFDSVFVSVLFWF